MNKKIENIAAIILLLVVAYLGVKTFFLDSSVDLPFMKSKAPVVNSAKKGTTNSQTVLPPANFDDKTYEKIKAKDNYNDSVTKFNSFKEGNNPFYNGF